VPLRAGFRKFLPNHLYQLRNHPDTPFAVIACLFGNLDWFMARVEWLKRDP
jgi:hypothetical protein